MKINKLRYKKLDFFIPKKRGQNQILKIIVFVDSIDKEIAFSKYLQVYLLKELKSQEKKIVRSFSLNLKSKTKTNRLQEVFNQ